MNPLLMTDGYKTSHHQQYPEGTTLVYSNWTPRSNKYAPKGCDKIVVFGTQMAIRILHEVFQYEFFSKPKQEVCGEMRKELSLYLGYDYDVTHFEKLHDLGYLPIAVKSLPEGTLCPIKVPVLTIWNTHSDFYWITNYLETILSSLLWKPMTSATIAYQYKKVLKEGALKTDKDNIDFVDFQGHDFSMRGMDGVPAVERSGLGHLTSFLGTDSLPTVHAARKYYDEEGFVAASVPATEHSVMCAGSKEGELETFKRLLDIYPKGILSVVSDTWDLWNVITNILPQLKEQILSRNGKLVIRPDSGDPVDIVCGRPFCEDMYNAYNNNELFKVEGGYREVYNAAYYPDGYEVALDDKLWSDSEQKGVIELLWDIFGGTINEQGYKVLDPHIGAIYGDSITLERAEEICRRLEAKGFASTNIILGIGSFTYQYNTRDTFGFAMKSTYIERDIEDDNGFEAINKGFEIFKSPITDDGTKKSATGLLCVQKHRTTGEYVLLDRVSWGQEEESELQEIYCNGNFYNKITLTEIRQKLNNG